MRAHQFEKFKDHDISASGHHHAVIIDAARGIYSVAKSRSGPHHPLHVKKITSTGTGAISFCEDNTCREVKDSAHRGGHVSYECSHIRSVPHAVPGVETVLDPAKLDELVTSRYITKERASQTKALQEDAQTKSLPFLVLIPPPPNENQSYLFLSVHSKKKKYWSMLSRSVISFNRKTKTTICSCSGQYRPCVHKSACKWYLYQECPDLLRHYDEADDEAEVSDHEREGGSEEVDTTETQLMGYPPKDQASLQRQYSYVAEYKRYPPKVDIKDEAILQQLPIRLIPREINCQACDGRLSEPQMVTDKGKIVLRDRIIEGKLCCLV
jgi:hypothetical protein